MNNNKIKITACFKKIQYISILQLLEMHRVFVQYYHNANLHNFVTDMGKKTGVIILQEKNTKKIIGFSTWTELNIIKGDKKSIGIFSGDTVVEKEYWGNKELQKTFVKQLLKTKIKNPKTSVFWLLISKGYKTYLLLTNNFPKHYPSHKKNNIKLESIVDEYCEQLYPDAYNKDDRLLNFGDDYQYLKDDVADITPDMTDENLDIRHFTKLNPSWQQGTELPCVGEVSLHMMWRFMRKNLFSVKNKNAHKKYVLAKNRTIDKAVDKSPTQNIEGTKEENKDRILEPS
ncbi:MAG: hypothetical protein ACI9T9_000452 [Oleiphilaceae bacterium]|jgi:hypothetical protein